jgi:hypothetical protein
MEGHGSFSQGDSMNQNQTAPLSSQEVYERGKARVEKRLEEIRQKQATQPGTAVQTALQEPVIQKEVVAPVTPVQRYRPPTPIPVGPGVVDRDDDLTFVPDETGRITVDGKKGDWILAKYFNQ